MKSFLCLLGLFVAAMLVSGETPEELKKHFEECKSELGLPDEKPEGDVINDDDSKVKCFHACLMKKHGNMENGKIVPEKEIETAMKHIPDADDAVKEKVKECIDAANKESDECDVAGAMHKCITEKIGNHHHHHHHHHH